MKKINIDNYNSYKELLSIVLNLYKIWENKIIFYTLEQRSLIIKELMDYLIDYLYKFKDKMYVKFILIPICLVKNSEYIELFFDVNIEGYIWYINYKNNKKCISCDKYNNCFWSINSDFKLIAFNEYSKNHIFWKELLNKLTFINDYFSNMWIKIWFYSHIYDINLIIEGNLYSDIKLINCVILEWHNFFRRWYIWLDKNEYNNTIESQWFEHNLLLKEQNYEKLNYIFNKTWLSLEFFIVKSFSIFQHNTIINNNNIYIKYNDFKTSILEILENIFIVKKINIKNKLFIWTWIWIYIWKLIFISSKDIYGIKSDFDKYIVFINDSINQYIPDIYKFKYFITHKYNPIIHFAIILREIWWDLFHWVNYDFLLNLKSGDILKINFKTWEVMTI